MHGSNLTIPLLLNFVDSDGDALTMTAMYTLNGGSPLPIPGGIFSKPAPFRINVTSVGSSDVGIYTISVIMSDSQLAVTASFTLNITNAIPRLNSTLQNINAPLNEATIIDLMSNFTDDDGDPMTLTVTYSFNGGAPLPIPGGIFTMPSLFMIEADPKGPSSVGIYTFSLTVSDSAESITSSFQLTVKNAPIKFTATLPN